MSRDTDLPDRAPGPDDGDDAGLGDLLQAIPTPAHRPGFWADLRHEVTGDDVSPDDPPATAAGATELPLLLDRREVNAQHRAETSRRRRRLGLLGAAAAVLVAVVAVGQILRDDAEDSVGVATDPDGAVDPAPDDSAAGDPDGAVDPAPGDRPYPLSPAGDPVAAGDGELVAVDPSGTWGFFEVRDPEGGLGCEGAPREVLVSRNLVDGVELAATPDVDLDATGAVRMAFGPDDRVALVPICEGFGSTVHVGRLLSDGTIGDVSSFEMEDVDGIVDLGFSPAGGVVTSTVALAADPPTRDLRLDGGPGGTILPEGVDDVVWFELAVDGGRLVTLDTDGFVRHEGDVVLGEAPGAFGLAMSTSGETVVAWGEAGLTVLDHALSGAESLPGRLVTDAQVVDDKTVVFLQRDADGTTSVWAYGLGGEPVLLADFDEILSFTVTPDARTLYVTESTGSDGGSATLAVPLQRP